MIMGNDFFRDDWPPQLLPGYGANTGNRLPEELLPGEDSPLGFPGPDPLGDPLGSGPVGGDSMDADMSGEWFAGDSSDGPAGLDSGGLPGNPLSTGVLDDFEQGLDTMLNAGLWKGLDNEASSTDGIAVTDDLVKSETSSQGIPGPPVPGRAPHEIGHGLAGGFLEGIPFEAELSAELEDALLRAGLLPDEGVFRTGPGLYAQSSGEEQGRGEEELAGDGRDPQDLRLSAMLDSLEQSIEGSEEKAESGAGTASKRRWSGPGAGRMVSGSGNPSGRSSPGPHPRQHPDTRLWSEPPLRVRRPRMRLKRRWKPRLGVRIPRRQRFSSARVFTWCPRVRDMVPEEDCIESGCEYANFEAWLESFGEEERCTHPGYWDYMFERITGNDESGDRNGGGSHESGI